MRPFEGSAPVKAEANYIATLEKMKLIDKRSDYHKSVPRLQDGSSAFSLSEKISNAKEDSEEEKEENDPYV